MSRVLQREILCFLMLCVLPLGACQKQPPVAEKKESPAQPAIAPPPPNTATEKPGAAQLGEEDRKRYRVALKKGRELTKKTDYAGAIAAFTEALSAKPKDPAALSELGWAAFLNKDLERARTTTEEAVAQAPQPAVKAASLYNLGRIEEELAHKDKAIEAYRSSLALREHKVVRARLEKLGGTAPAASASTSDSEFKMPCDKVLKLGEDKFSELYQDKNDDHSESAEDQAALYYEECLHKRNEPRLAALPAETRTQLTTFYKALTDWESAFYHVAFFGGTLARHMSVRADISQEELVSQLIDILQKPAAPKGNLAAKQTAEIKRLRKLVKEASDNDAYDDDEKDMFRDEVKSLKDAQAELEKALKTVPPAVLGKVLDHLHQMCATDCK